MNTFMKKIIYSAMLFTLNLSAGELTGAGARALLTKNGINPQILEQTGHRIMAGELTGAGKMVDINRIEYFMTDKKVYSMNEVRQVILDPRAERAEREGRLPKPTLNDVKSLEVNQAQIGTTLIQAVVIKEQP